MTVNIRLGIGKSIFLEIVASAKGRIINLVDYELGTSEPLYNLTDQSSLILGRTAECNIKINHAYVSRQHLEMSADGEFLVIRDLGSSNKTYYLTDAVGLNIEEYVIAHPGRRNPDDTLDDVHETFGPQLDDFLQRYIDKKEKQNDTLSDN